ncbi:MAG TPA: hypothetical protein VEI07_24180 [Planctomycetaceae bacterium]|nr:hypothetical protein [Planctomycetaceae bacterium]
MKTARFKIVVVIVGISLLGVSGALLFGGGSAQEKDSLRDKVKLFMRSKLTNSQNVIEGLATENWDLIEAGGARMLVMSKATEWSVGQTGPQYKQDTTEFVNACKQLITQSKAKNLEGATLAYLQLTMNCVECHKHVRANQRTGENRPR